MKKMKFAVQINCSPFQQQGAVTAYRFICAALNQGHSIYRVFFYFDGAYNAFAQMIQPDDEQPVIARWVQLAKDHAIDLVVCISAAQRRGLLDPVEAKRRSVECQLADGFRISGLGQWVDACLEADRVLVFGG